MYLSVIVPCFNEELNIDLFYKSICPIVKRIAQNSYEIIFVDDGSKDNTLDKIKEISKVDPQIKFISFSRNFGKEAAMLAGLEACSGTLTAIMDVDLQDPPEMLIEMEKELIASKTSSLPYNCIGSRRTSRKGEPIIRSMFAHLFYKLINKISDIEIVEGARDFRLMDRKMVDAILDLKEKNRFSKGIFEWVGFKKKYLEYENKERTAGNSKWSFWSLFKYSLDGIFSFSTVPLTIVAIIGAIVCLIALILTIIFIIERITNPDLIPGYATLITIILFLGGVQTLSLGIVGQYLAKMFIEIKDRPIYIVKDKSESLCNNSKN